MTKIEIQVTRESGKETNFSFPCPYVSGIKVGSAQCVRCEFCNDSSPAEIYCTFDEQTPGEKEARKEITDDWISNKIRNELNEFCKQHPDIRKSQIYPGGLMYEIIRSIVRNLRNK